jgi:flagellar protein FliS
LLLVEGAIRFGRQALNHWENGHDGPGAEACSRCRAILSELLAGLRPEVAPELVKQVADLYGFIYRRLVEAQIRRDALALKDALRVLEEERETWRAVTRGSAPRPPVDDAASESLSRPAAQKNATEVLDQPEGSAPPGQGGPRPKFPSLVAQDVLPRTGFSIEA